MYAPRRSQPAKRQSRTRVMTAGLVFGALAFLAVVQSNRSRPVDAATTSATFTVRMTIQPTCTISANPLAFPQYLGAMITATTTLTINCTNKTAYNVGLNAGTASGATVTARKVTSGGNTLNYELFSNSGHTVNWGETAGTDAVAGTGSGSAQTLTVYGRVPAAQIGAPATYTDTIVATVTY